MTWSIVARDPDTGQLGVAVSTKFLAVGSLCPFARAGVGAIATQAFVNPLYGPRGLRLLAEGLSPQRVIDVLVEGDSGREHRQVHMVDQRGQVAAWTGKECVDWCGHRLGEDFSVAGNMLTGPEVIEATYEAYLTNKGVPFAERLLRALEAGQQAGGDKRGRQSASLYIVDTEEYPYLDLRVDDHPDPVAELRRLYEEAMKEYLPFKRFLPTKANPAGIVDADIVSRVLEEQRRNEEAARRARESSPEGSRA